MKGGTHVQKRQASKREVVADPIDQQQAGHQHTTRSCLNGKKGVAEHIVYSAFDIVAEKTGNEAIDVFEEALKNIMPVLEVKARRVGGANYQVPIEVRADRRQTLGLRRLVSFARKRGEKTMDLRLANEIMDAANNTGGAVKKKEETHRMAEANKAFAHYRW